MELDKLLADGAYDSNNTFRCLSDNGTVEPRDICHPLTATGTGSMSSSLSAFTKRKYQPSSL